MVVDSTHEIANMIKTSIDLGFPNGMVIAVPNPNPADSEYINTAIANALSEAKQLKIEGAKITPYILSRVEKLTQGKSLDANISLVLNNSKVAASIAIELNRLESNTSGTFGSSIFSSSSNTATSTTTSSSNQSNNSEHKLQDRTVSGSYVAVVGGSVADFIASPVEKNSLSESTDDPSHKVLPSLIIHSSNPGKLHVTVGGVGRNIATVLGRLGNTNTVFLSAVSDDLIGKMILEDLKKRYCVLTIYYHSMIYECN
jgi:hypothetical protein